MKKSILLKISLIILLIILIYLFYQYVYDGTEHYRSTVDNNFYKIRKGGNSQLRADILATIYKKFKIIITALKRDSNFNQLESVKRLVNTWNNGITVKEIGNMESDAAYVINKKYMSFCIQTKTNAYNTSDINLITYVGLHELAHIMSVEIGHGPEFIENFEILLNYAKQLKYFDTILNAEVPLYIQLNKIKTADNYCGVPLTNSIN